MSYLRRVRRLGSDLMWAAGQFARRWFVTFFSVKTHIRIAAVRGWFYRVLRRGAPRHVRDNVELAFPGIEPSEADRIASDLCEFVGRMYLWRLLPCIPGARHVENWPVEGLEHLEAALARKHGVLLVTAHFGYGHIIPTALAAHGHAVARVIAELEHLERRGRTEEWLARAGRVRRYAYSHTRVLADRLGSEDMVANLDVRPIFDRLSRNGIVMTAGDGLRSMQFSDLPLLGRKHPFPNGLIKIAMLSKASVLPVFAVQNGRSGKIRVQIHPPLAIDHRSDVTENLRLLADTIEKQIRQRPHLWHRWMIADWFQVAQEWSNGDRKTRYKSALQHERIRGRNVPY